MFSYIQSVGTEGMLSGFFYKRSVASDFLTSSVMKKC